MAKKRGTKIAPKGKNKKVFSKKSKKSYSVKVKRSNTDIIEDLRKELKTYKNIAKKLKITTNKLRQYRKFYARQDGGIAPPEKFINKFFSLAKKLEIPTEKKVKAYRGEILGEELISKKFKIDKKAAYIHAIFSVKVTRTNGQTFEDIYSQVYYPPITEKEVKSNALAYFKSIMTRPYVLSIELTNFSVNSLNVWYK